MDESLRGRVIEAAGRFGMPSRFAPDAELDGALASAIGADLLVIKAATSAGCKQFLCDITRIAPGEREESTRAQTLR